ncbi:MAG: hypothetical protein BIFFINMI_04311 [Phycisphaerae bacterium]|nr:hypothetical protein [Phycisphaerae bacterium]
MSIRATRFALSISLAFAATFVLASAGPARAATYDAPLDTRKEGKVAFTSPPKAESAGDKIKVSFAVSTATDVEVAVLDAAGGVVRHLAAGLLGPHAPAPLTKDALAQVLFWDRTDDIGQPAGSGPFTVRVRLGATPRLDRHVGWDGNTFAGIVGLAVGKGGEVFVLTSEIYRGGTELRVLDARGKYLRTIMPYAADTPKERLATVGQLDIDGERLPIIFNGLGRTTYPLTSGMRRQSMAVHPKGYLVMVSALGTMAEHGPPRHLLAVDPRGGAPEGVNLVGPRVRKARGFMGGAGEGSAGCFDHVAASPDGQWVYLSVGPRSRLDGKRNGVLRMKWSDAAAGDLWLGKDEPGDDDAHFNSPEGLATDARGNLYVCDWGNNRVMVFDPDGKLLGKLAVDKPQQIAVDAASGDVYVLSLNLQPRWGLLWGGESVLRKFKFAFAPGAAGEAKELARLDNKGMYLMALDPSASPARLWIAGPGLYPVADKGDRFEAGPSAANRDGLELPWFIAGDPDRNRVLIYEHSEAGKSSPGIIAMDLTTGKKSALCKGTDMALDRGGNVYAMGGRDNAIYRYDPSGKPLPFSALGTNKLMTKGYRGYGPFLGLPGLAVAPNGDIYVMRTSNYGDAQSYGGRVDVFSSDGKPKAESIIDGLGYGDCGLGVDAAGNIYVGANVKPADKLFPPAFVGKLPDKGWVWWKAERPFPWNYPYYYSYLYHWGSVFKFGPGGGAFYGQNARQAKDPKYGPPKPADSLANAPADAVTYRSGYLAWDVKEAGAQWRYAGCGIVPTSDCNWGDPYCICHQSHLAVDEYGRSFVPDVFQFSVMMLDTSGNQVARIGRYGNADSAGPGSTIPDPEIGLAWPAYVSVRGGKLFISDALNRRITVVKFEPSAEATCTAR